MCLRWLGHTSPLPCSLQSIRIVTLTPSQICDALVRQFTRLFYSVLQQGHSFGVWEMICKDNQRGPSIHRVWIRVVSHARSEIDPRSLRKSFSGAWEGPVTFLRMSERLQVWLSQSRRPCLFQKFAWKNKMKPNRTKQKHKQIWQSWSHRSPRRPESFWSVFASLSGVARRFIPLMSLPSMWTPVTWMGKEITGKDLTKL